MRQTYQVVTICVFLLLSQLGVAQETSNMSPDYWKAQIQSNPNNAVNFLNLGVAYHKQRDFKKALKAYKKVISLKSSLAPVANYYGAQIFKDMGKVAKAKSVMERVNIQDLPENLRKRVLLFKNSLYVEQTEEETEATAAEGPAETEQKEKRYSAYFEASYGTNDNPSYSTAKTYDGQLKLLASLSYQLWVGDEYELKGAYSYTDTKYGKTSSSDYSYHDVTLPFAYYIDTTRIRLVPEYLATNYAGVPFSSSTGSAADVAARWEQFYLTFYVQYLILGVEDSSTYSYLKGASTKYKLSLRTQWSQSQVTATMGYNDYDYDDTSSYTSSYKAPVVSLTYGWYYGDWDITAYGSYESRTYNKDSSNATRKDELTTFSLQPGYSFSRYVRGFLDAAFTADTSNSSGYGYEQTTLTAGLSASF
ncbi:MAG: hypothetical protein AB7F86_02280 [Bdellovibrionales bacterium]